MPPVGVVGLGTIGVPVARRLIDAGHAVHGFDVRAAAHDAVGRERYSPASGLADLAASCRIVLFLVPGSDDVRDGVLGHRGLVATATHPLLIVDMTTSDPRRTRRLAAQLERTAHQLIDAPFTGGRRGATRGELVLMIGGDSAAIAELGPVLRPLSSRRFHLGEAGSGHAMKLVHNLVSHAVFLATCEGVATGVSWGMDAARIVEVLDAGNASSYSTAVRFPEQVITGRFDGGASARTVLKDITVAIELLGSRSRAVPILQSTLDHWRRLAERVSTDADYTEAYRLVAEDLDADM